MKRKSSLAAALATGLLALACGTKPPELPAIEWRIEMQPSKQGAYESLSVFANVRDDNGPEDIDELWVVQDEARLAWRLTSANWTKRTEGSDTWIGSAGLALDSYQSLPRGDYRMMAIDAAGDRAERSFKVEGAFPDRPPPSVAIAGDKLSIRSSWPETLVLAFDAAGQLLASKGAPQQASGLDELFGTDIAAKTRELAAYGYDPAAHAGYYSRRIGTK